jgi:molecular chaperone GrpE
MSDATKDERPDSAEDDVDAMLDEVADTDDEASEDAEHEDLDLEDVTLMDADEIREVVAKAEECDQYVDRLQRLQAEFDNYRRRIAREREGWRRNAVQGLLLEVLGVVDNLERALAIDAGPEGHAAFVEGIELVGKQFSGVLEKMNVKPIDAKGQPFDPALHEALTMVPTDKAKSGTVLEDVLRGYTMDDVVLRPTRVCVAQSPAPVEPDAAAADDNENDETD